ncbi:hypothetical protein AURDEDRAFT_183275 [Auricularia subglabra TFB-10046 SS5]|nr:hypothetical protein AURDEDRAFT_183275 [Auricularia subglabra TFB-10046 SS5]
MSTRRDSRVHLAARQNDALLEFENFKKKYLLVNKHITKLNSTLSVRIEELNAQISELYVENLRLRASEISLAAQLQRERDKTRRLMHDAETAVSADQTSSLATRLSTLRDAYNIPPGVEAPKLAGITETQPPLRAQKPLRSSSSSPPRPARVSRPPDFTRIAEDDEDAVSSPAREQPERPSSRLEMTFERDHHYQIHQPTLAEVDFSHRAPRRRQSGLVTTLMRGDVEDVTTPATFREPPPEPESDAGHEEMDIVDLAPPLPPPQPTPVLRKTRRLSGPTPSPAPLPPDDDQQEREERERREREERERKEREREERKEREREERAREKARLRAEREKEKERARLAEEQLLQQQQQQQELQRRPFTELPLNPSSTSQALAKSLPPSKLPQPVERVATPVDQPADQPAAEGRERRARKSVNYAEPKLNTKMRKPDPPEGTAPAPAPRRKKSSSSSTRRPVVPVADDAAEFADAEGVQSTAATYVRRHTIAV